MGHRHTSRFFALCVVALLAACDDVSDDGVRRGPAPGPANGVGMSQVGDAGQDAAAGRAQPSDGGAGAGGAAGSSAGQAGVGGGGPAPGFAGAGGIVGTGAAGQSGPGTTGPIGPGPATTTCAPAGASCFNSLASCCGGLICCSSIPCSDFVGTCQINCCP